MIYLQLSEVYHTHTGMQLKQVHLLQTLLLQRATQFMQEHPRIRQQLCLQFLCFCSKLQPPFLPFSQFPQGQKMMPCKSQRGHNIRTDCLKELNFMFSNKSDISRKNSVLKKKNKHFLLQCIRYIRFSASFDQNNSIHCVQPWKVPIF